MCETVVATSGPIHSAAALSSVDENASHTLFLIIYYFYGQLYYNKIHITPNAETTTHSMHSIMLLKLKHAFHLYVLRIYVVREWCVRATFGDGVATMKYYTIENEAEANAKQRQTHM